MDKKVKRQPPKYGYKFAPHVTNGYQGKTMEELDQGTKEILVDWHQAIKFEIENDENV